MLMRLAVRNVFRNTRRSLLTAGMVTLGSALLCVGTAWLQGVSGGMLDLATSGTGHVRVVQQEYADLEQMMPIYLNVEEVESLAQEIRTVDGVKGAYPRISLGTTITKTEVIGDHFALVLGAPFELYEHEYGLKGQLEPGGGWFEGPGDVLVGGKVKEKLGLKLGEDVVMNGMTQDGSFSAVKGRVVGFVRGDNPIQQRQVFMSLEQMQYLADMPGAATEILVYGEDRDQALRLSKGMEGLSSLNKLLVQPWSDREPWAGMVAMMSFITFIIIIIIVFITSLGVWNTMTISVMERTGEIGVLRALGMKRLTTVSLFVIEAMIIGIIGGVLGVLLGGVPAYYLEVVGVSIPEGVVENMDVPFSATIRADLNAFVVCLTFMTAASMAFLGSALPALRAAFIQPVEAMRARR